MLRQSDPVLSRLGTSEVSIESAAPAPHVSLIRYLSAYGQRLLVTNVGADFICPMNDPLFAPLPGTFWETALSSDSPSYGGAGFRPVRSEGPWHIHGNSATILAPRPIG
jgi:hypothetical protein